MEAAVHKVLKAAARKKLTGEGFQVVDEPRASPIALIFLKEALRLCLNKPRVIVDKGPWYPWALQRLGLEYEHQRFGVRNRVERFFRYLKERTTVFHNKLSAMSYAQGIRSLKPFLNLFTPYYQTLRRGGR